MGNKYDKLLAAAAQDASRLEDWKVAVLQQAERQTQTLSNKTPTPSKSAKAAPKKS